MSTEETKTNKHVLRVLSAALAVLLFCGAAISAGAGAGATLASGTFDGIDWFIRDGTLTITGYGEIPDYSYAQPAPWMEHKDSLKALVIDPGVTKIGDYAFSGCSGFTGSLDIPTSVKTIGNSAFEGCSGFTGPLTIPSGVQRIRQYVFEGCSGFDGPLTIPETVTEINRNAFRGCSGFTGSLTIPDSVKTIDVYAFEGCRGFTSLNIGSSVQTIVDWAFKGCSGFTGSLIIPNSVRHIGNSAFSGCSGFDGSLTIPSGVTLIDTATFRGCSGFTSLKIGYGVERIYSSAFEGCRGITSLTIPGTVNWIGERAFYGCGLTNPVTIPSDVTTIDNDSLAGQVRAGYTFGGWYDNSAYSGDPVASYAAGKTYYPKWMLKHNITVSSDGHGDVSAPESAAEGTIVHLITKPHDGYEFDKWDVIKGDISIENNEFTMPASDVEIHATFTPINYTVTYDGNGASGGQVPAAQTYAYGSSIMVSGNTGNLTKDGFKFVGWNTQKDGKGIDYPVGSTFTITDNITLYADWTEIEKYSITIQTIGPGTVISDPASASEGELIHLHVSANPGYQLTQWYVYPEFITIHDDMTFLMPAEDVYFHGLFDKKDPEPIPRPKKSTSQGSSVWLTEPAAETQPTATPTQTPVPVETPGVKPVNPSDTPAKTPAPFLGILAGLGAAAAVFALRRK